MGKLKNTIEYIFILLKKREFDVFYVSYKVVFFFFLKIYTSYIFLSSNDQDFYMFNIYIYIYIYIYICCTDFIRNFLF